MIAITGNTYPVKDQIKALGGKWDAASKSWMVPDDKADQARALLPAAPVKQNTYRSVSSNTRGIPGVNMPCRSCGGYCYGDCEAN